MFADDLANQISGDLEKRFPKEIIESCDDETTFIFIRGK
jgi:hypothetical protein